MLNESLNTTPAGSSATTLQPSCRILIVARPDFAADGMVSLLNHHRERYQVTSIHPEVFNARLVSDACPDILLLNSNVNTESLEHYFDEIRKACENTVVLLFGHGMDDNYLYNAMRAGARGYLNENMRGEHLTTALDTVAEGGYWAERHILCQFISDKSVHDKIDENVKTLSQQLTTRESEVLELILEGMTTNEIAERIFLSHQGVKAHLTNLFRKFGVKNRAQLILTVLDTIAPVPSISDLAEKGLRELRGAKNGRNRAA